MDKEIELKDRYSPQIKKLIYHSETDTEYCYKLEAKWPGYPEYDNYMRIGYNDDTKYPRFIDFDGGPMISIGSKINGHTVSNIKNLDKGVFIYLNK